MRSQVMVENVKCTKDKEKNEEIILKLSSLVSQDWLA